VSVEYRLDLILRELQAINRKLDHFPDVYQGEAPERAKVAAADAERATQSAGRLGPAAGAIEKVMERAG
jgi:hypothetical protein